MALARGGRLRRKHSQGYGFCSRLPCSPPTPALDSGYSMGNPGLCSFSKEFLTTYHKENKEHSKVPIFKFCFVFPKGPFISLSPAVPGNGGVGVPGLFLDCVTGREAYFNLQKAERNMKELKELFKGGVRKSQVSEKDLTIALGR